MERRAVPVACRWLWLFQFRAAASRFPISWLWVNPGNCGGFDGQISIFKIQDLGLQFPACTPNPPVLIDSRTKPIAPC